ncbi:unnamed protein product, partial [Ectocarpus sp. 4 AP-2014]
AFHGYTRPADNGMRLPRTIQDNTPPRPISKLDYSATKRMHQQSDTLSEMSRPDSFNAAVLGVASLPAVDNKSSFENLSRGCVILCHIRYMRAFYACGGAPP